MKRKSQSSETTSFHQSHETFELRNRSMKWNVSKCAASQVAVVAVALFHFLDQVLPSSMVIKICLRLSIAKNIEFPKLSLSQDAMLYGEHIEDQGRVESTSDCACVCVAFHWKFYFQNPPLPSELRQFFPSTFNSGSSRFPMIAPKSQKQAVVCAGMTAAAFYIPIPFVRLNCF
jgi:hypothetical protein